MRTILLTMYDGRTKLADQVADEVRNHFGDLVLRAVIPRNVRVSEAPGYGQTVMTYDPGSRGAISYSRPPARSPSAGSTCRRSQTGARRRPPPSRRSRSPPMPYGRRQSDARQAGGLGRGLAALIPTGPAPRAHRPACRPEPARPPRRPAAAIGAGEPGRLRHRRSRTGGRRRWPRARPRRPR